MKRYDVIVIGDLFCDIVTAPIADYPERDRQIGCKFALDIGGQAANCAVASASLGLKTALICKTGSDMLSQWLRSELQKRGVECFASVTEKEDLQHPGITVSIAFKDGSRSMLSDRGANIDFAAEDIRFDLLSETRFIMRAGHWNTEALFSANKQILESAKSAAIDTGTDTDTDTYTYTYTGLDIGWSAYLGWTAHARQTVFDLLPSIDFLFINEAEMHELLSEKKGIGEEDREGEGEGEEKGAYAYELLEKGCKNVIIHRGVHGSAWITKEFEIRSPAFDVQPINPTGAGDVFNAGFIYAVLNGREARECLRFANACAATYISRIKR